MIEPDAATIMDPRLVLLARAAARYYLVEAGAMTLDEAWEGLFEEGATGEGEEAETSVASPEAEYQAKLKRWEAEQAEAPKPAHSSEAEYQAKLKRWEAERNRSD